MTDRQQRQQLQYRQPQPQQGRQPIKRDDNARPFIDQKKHAYLAEKVPEDYYAEKANHENEYSVN